MAKFARIKIDAIAFTFLVLFVVFILFYIYFCFGFSRFFFMIDLFGQHVASLPSRALDSRRLTFCFSLNYDSQLNDDIRGVRASERIFH